MYKSSFHCIVVLILSLSFSCSNKGDKNKSDKVFGVCKMIIVSPYGCYQEIEFTDNGDGVFKSGLYTGSIMDEGVSLDTVFSIDSFHILKEQDIKSIHSVITSILSTKNVKGRAKTDTYRHKLFIDGVNKIDIFGLSKDLQELLIHIINYLPLSNDKCEFFELFKKSISRQNSKLGEFRRIR